MSKNAIKYYFDVQVRRKNRNELLPVFPLPHPAAADAEKPSYNKPQIPPKTPPETLNQWMLLNMLSLLVEPKVSINGRAQSEHNTQLINR